MWIERIDFAGYGKFAGERVEFKPASLNIVAAPNDYGKSLIAEAVWSIVFDFPRPEGLTLRDSRKPRTTLPYIASIDLSISNGALKIIRDFEDGSVQVIDREQSNADVTEAFLSPNNEDEVGIRLTGLTREQFLSSFILSQASLDDLEQSWLAAQPQLCSLIQDIAGGATPEVDSAFAVDLLEQTLMNYGADGNSIDELIAEAEARQNQLQEELARLEETREQMSRYLQDLANAPEPSAASNEPARANEYFQLCLAAADLDNKIIRAQKRLTRLNHVKQEANRFEHARNFPADTEKQVDELWTRRQTRMSEHELARKELEPKKAELAMQEKQSKQRWRGFMSFTQEEAQSLGVLAINFQNLTSELNELRKRREAETEKIKSQAIDVTRIEDMRRAMLALEAKDFEDARTYEALINSARSQIGECERAIGSARGVINEIEEQKRAKKMMFLPSSYKKKELDSAEKEIQQRSTLMQELRNKVGNLEMRLDTLARKAGLRDGGQLLQQMQEYASKAPYLKDLEGLDQLVSSREANLDRVRSDLTTCLVKGEWEAENISPERAVQLASEAKKAVEEARALKSLGVSVQKTQQQIKFLESEIRDVNNLLEAVFIRADVSDPSAIERAYQQYIELSKTYHVWEAKNRELENEQNKLYQEAPAADWDLEGLEAARNNTWIRMQELVNEHPEIAEAVPPLGEGQSAPTTPPQPRVPQEAIDRDGLIEQVRAIADEFDENYLPKLQALQSIERWLENAHNSKMALEFAAKTLASLPQERQVDWLVRLNRMAHEFAVGLGLNYDRIEFSRDLHLRVQPRGDAEFLEGNAISEQLSAGSRKMLHIFARLVFGKVLSERISLPFVLDEPFCEIDDDQFLRTMQFLLDHVVADNQVIMFSCHQSRLDLLQSKLSEAQKGSLHFCERTSLRAQAEARKH